MRPSNSGMATCVAASSGARPESDSSQAAREAVAQTAWITGTSSSGERGGVPFLPLLADALAVAGSGVRGPGAARGEHRHDQRVHVAGEQRQRGHVPRPVRSGCSRRSV